MNSWIINGPLLKANKFFNLSLRYVKNWTVCWLYSGVRCMDEEKLGHSVTRALHCPTTQGTAKVPQGSRHVPQPPLAPGQANYCLWHLDVTSGIISFQCAFRSGALYVTMYMTVQKIGQLYHKLTNRNPKCKSVRVGRLPISPQSRLTTKCN